ncbi:predicted protein [Histoplasma capsulatum G186AR]|uniref:Enoyl reductase (ER) domain-containing protein n=1 Tax=Ajellomyces capsulatus (strain G186AR / H82 / ATCC MYA-2454 / RMSCC 2432) TaxID=447093 RepID=C0NG20_AJECG|nr:uncharacterized protein HCBG_01836 [Histoplasma capsulatum G186AR]EEH10191.1 predicted protein [Histoplasma capsulatum G186AR]
MKGIICEKAGEPFKIVDNLDVPEPSSDQILVKSIYMGLNPVDGMMQSSGVIVHEWPLFLGVDVAGVVVKVGENAASMFKVGDHVCGCTRVGYPGYNSGQEYLLMDAKITIPKPKNISLVEAATIGVGLELFGICGYKVMASSSAYSVPLVKNQGAEAVFDYKMSIAEQVNEVLSITKGKVHRVFDAAASGDEFAKELYRRLPEEGPKLFCSTNAWSGITDFEGVKTKVVELAVIGRPHAEHTNKVLAEYIPVFVALFEHENQLFPPPYDLVGQGGFEDALEAHQYQQKGAGRSNKVVAKIQDE